MLQHHMHDGRAPSYREQGCCLPQCKPRAVAGDAGTSSPADTPGEGPRCSLPALASAWDKAARSRERRVALTFVKRRVQEGVVEEQAATLSPALGLAPHHQLTVAGCLQTFGHKERGQGGSGCC